MDNFCTVLILVILVSGMLSEDACSSGLCRCNAKRVFCMGLNLTYIPKVPSRTTRMTFTNNSLTNITRETMANISYTMIFKLELMNNQIRNIDKDAFKNITNLYIVNMSENPLTMKSVYAMVYVAETIGLTSLYFRGIGLKSLPSDLFQGMESSYLNFMDFSQNSLRSLNYTIFKPLQRLQQLKLEFNLLTSVTLDYAPTLNMLDLSSNRIRDLPNFCDNDHPYFPRLANISLENNTICEYIPKNMNCLKTLSYFRFAGNCISVIRTNSFALLSSLTQLFLQFHGNFQSAYRIDSFAFNNSNIQQLELAGNGLKTKHINALAFYGCTNISILGLENNIFTSFTPEDEQRINEILSPLKQLQHLRISHSGLNNIPSAVKHFHKLQSLILHDNNIKSWSKDLFLQNTNLKVLRLQRNQIKTVTESMFPSQLRSQLTGIALGGNPFICNCDLVWFVEWIHRDYYKFAYFPKDYRCLNITQRVCFDNLQLYDSVTAVTCIIIMVLLIAAIVHKYRWFIKYQIYIWRHQPKLRELIVEREYQYDVFVSYCETDGDWIVNHLLPKLEEEEHLKLCIHERDFRAGKLILDNIVDAIENSRRVLIVLSNGFAQSEWCQFEASMAQRHVLNEVNDPLVVVLLEDIDIEFMTNTLRVLLKTTTHMTWEGGNPEDVYLFWNRLKLSLQTD